MSDVLPSKNSLAQVHQHLLIPASYACMDMEHAGCPVSVSKLEELDTRYTQKINELIDQIRSFPEIRRVEKRIGKPFNINSPDQVREAIFKEFGLTADDLELTDGGKLKGDNSLISTGKANMAKLEGQHEIIDILKQQRKYSTLYKMFIKPIKPKYLSPDNKIHVSYKIHGTVTGRLSVSLLHQIPKNIDPDEIGFDFDPDLNIKHMFVPENSEFDLLQADYSQMELRILAEYAQDEAMLGIFNRGEDIHIATGANMASIVYGSPVQYNEATRQIEVCNRQGIMEVIDKKSKWRKAAKAINFGIVYGKGDESLAIDLGCSIEEAREFKRHYFAAFPGVAAFIDYVHSFVKENHYVTTMFGNIRRLLSITSPNRGTKNEALRQAVNMPIQGTAGHYTLCSLININEILKQFNMKSRIIATVHDSILFNRYRKESSALSEIVSTVMSNPSNPLIYWDAVVPLVCDLECSEKSWALLK